MEGPTIVVPVDYSPAGTSIPPGQQVVYSTIGKVKSYVGGIVGAVMQVDQHAAWAPYKTHLIITDQAVIYDGQNFGVKTFPLSDVYLIKQDKLYVSWARFRLVYDKVHTTEEKNAFKVRVKRFAYEVLPFIIANLKNLIESSLAAAISEREVKKLQRKLLKFEKDYDKLAKKM
nr:hypothetical protein [Candidatus Sigynarchaeum springense]